MYSRGNINKTIRIYLAIVFKIVPQLCWTAAGVSPKPKKNCIIIFQNRFSLYTNYHLIFVHQPLPKLNLVPNMNSYHCAVVQHLKSIIDC